MTTTHLFVELLVIGFGTLAWVVILAAAIFGYDDLSALKEPLLSLGALFPSLSLAYVFGILTDRVADWLFDELWGNHHLTDVYGIDNKNQFFEHRRELVVEGPELWQFIEYGRSRLRICRGWALNSAVLLVVVLMYAITTQSLTFWQAEGTVSFLLLVTALCWKSWSKLNRKEYEKIQRQADWIIKHNEKNKKQEIELSGLLNLERNEEYESYGEGSPAVSD